MKDSQPMNQESQPTADLIGFALELLDEREARETAAQVGRSQAMADAVWNIRRTLAPLDSLSVDSAGRELISRVLERTAAMSAAAGPTVRGASAGGRTAPRFGGWPRLLRGEEAPATGPIVSLRELIGLAAAVALFVSIFVPAYSRARTGAMQTACLNNLRMAGQAEIQYSENYAAAFPYAGGSTGRWLSSDAGTLPQASNSRHPYLVLLGNFVKDPRVFNDPGRPGDSPMNAQLVPHFRDFPELRNIGYSSPLLTEPMLAHRVDPAQPLLVDQNSMFENRQFTQRSVANSDSHGSGKGQNLFRADGGGGWFPRTDVGPGNDDIYSLANVSTYTGMEWPRFKSDVFLIP